MKARRNADLRAKYLFNLPLFFQVVLLDSATKAGARLAIPSLATPIGGLIAGVVMSRWGRLIGLVRTGAILMVIGNGLVTSLNFEDSTWKYFVYIFPANLGQGIVYPGILFTSLATFEHAGKFPHAHTTVPPSSELTANTNVPRPRRLRLDRLSHPLPRYRVGRGRHFSHSANNAQRPPTGRFG